MNKVAILARPSVKYDIIMLEELWEEKNRLFNFFRWFDQFTSTKIHKGGESP